MENNLLEIDVKTFNLKYTLECGQCFRWEKVFEDEKDKSKPIYEYIGIISDRVLLINQQGNKLYVDSNKLEGLKETVINYFDLDTDYEKLEKEIKKIDNNIEIAVKNSSGLRILNQPVFETIISYIISANNNIPRIKKFIDIISRKYGTKVNFKNKEYFLFPTIDELKNVEIPDCIEAGAGFRARYIEKAVSEIFNEEGFIEKIQKMSINEAKEKLLKLDGVGPKVSDCILLFSLGHKEVFPIDVWVKRIMEKIYFNKDTKIKEISELAKNKFGNLGGIIQEHLFYNIRKGDI